MKNIVLKSLMIFVVMSLLNAQLSEWSVRLLDLPDGSFGMFSMLILIFCSVITGIGLVTVLIFRKNYYSIIRIAVLFEILYSLMLFLTGTNPFLFFKEQKNEYLLNILLYTNSLLIFLAICLLNFAYSKIILTTSKN